MFTASNLYVQGAYGRSYDNEQDALRDWNDGKDFKVIRGPYLSMRSMTAMRAAGYERVLIALRTPPLSDAPKWAEIELNVVTVI